MAADPVANRPPGTNVGNHPIRRLMKPPSVSCMAHERPTATETTFLVEHYRRGETVDGVRRALARVRDAVAAMESAGKPIRHLRAAIVPDDEAYLCVFDADSEELVREAYTRAGVPFERISRAIADGDGIGSTHSRSEGETR